jgi:hypothetical protein
MNSLLFNRKFSDILIFSYCSIHDRLLTLCFYFIFLLTKRTSKVFVVVLTSNTSRENSIRIKIYFFLREDKATLVNVFLRPQQHTILNFFFYSFSFKLHTILFSSLSSSSSCSHFFVFDQLTNILFHTLFDSRFVGRVVFV